MGTDVLEIIYLTAFFLGVGFAVITGLMAGVFSGSLEGAGNVDVSGDQIHAGGHEVAHGDNIQLSPFSPITIAMFVTFFGATGFALKKWAGLPTLVHLPVASISGLVIAALIFFALLKIFKVTQASSHAIASDAIGQEAEVTVPLPADGVGEIAYTIAGSRFVAPAKMIDGKELPQRAIVKIVKIVGNTYIVEKVK